MKITKLYTGPDNLSYFLDQEIPMEEAQTLGDCSSPFSAKEIKFRETFPDKYFDWHNAPCLQYIIYLEGEMEVHASGGEKRIFKPGDILLAADVTGKGHISKSLSLGKAVIVRCE